METKTGTIIALKRHYGFIKAGDGTDIFFHEKGVISPSFSELREGIEVEYIETEDTDKRLKAIGVVAQ